MWVCDESIERPCECDSCSGHSSIHLLTPACMDVILRVSLAVAHARTLAHMLPTPHPTPHTHPQPYRPQCRRRRRRRRRRRLQTGKSTVVKPTGRGAV